MYISVGVDCGPANIFNELGLRTVSLPFDWVVTYKGVAHIINKYPKTTILYICNEHGPTKRVEIHMLL